MRLNFSLIQHNKITLTEIENMIPWERDVYVNLLVRFLREEEQRQKRAAGQSAPL